MAQLKSAAIYERRIKDVVRPAFRHGGFLGSIDPVNILVDEMTETLRQHESTQMSAELQELCNVLHWAQQVAECVNFIIRLQETAIQFQSAMLGVEYRRYYMSGGRDLDVKRIKLRQLLGA